MVRVSQKELQAARQRQLERSGSLKTEELAKTATAQVKAETTAISSNVTVAPTKHEMSRQLFLDMKQDPVLFQEVVWGLSLVVKPEIFFEALLEGLDTLGAEDVSKFTQAWLKEHTPSDSAREIVLKIADKLGKTGFPLAKREIIHQCENPRPPVQDPMQSPNKMSALEIFQRVQARGSGSNEYKKYVDTIANDLVGVCAHYINQITPGDVADQSPRVSRIQQIEQAVSSFALERLLAAAHDPQELENTMIFLLDVAEKCKESGEYSTPVAIYLALGSSALGRLSVAKVVHEKSEIKARFEQLKVFCGITKNNPAIRADIEARFVRNSPVLASISIHSKDVEFTKRGNPAIVEDTFNKNLLGLNANKICRYVAASHSAAVKTMVRDQASDITSHIVRLAQPDMLSRFEDGAYTISERLQPKNVDASREEFAQSIKSQGHLTDRLVYAMTSSTLPQVTKLFKSEPKVEEEIKETIDTLLLANAARIPAYCMHKVRDDTKLMAYDFIAKQIADGGGAPNLEVIKGKINDYLVQKIEEISHRGAAKFEFVRSMRDLLIRYLPVPYEVASRAFVRTRGYFTTPVGVQVHRYIKEFARKAAAETAGVGSGYEKEIERCVRLHNYRQIEEMLEQGVEPFSIRYRLTIELPPNFSQSVEGIKEKYLRRSQPVIIKQKIKQLHKRFGKKLEQLRVSTPGSFAPTLKRIREIESTIRFATPSEKKEFEQLKQALHARIKEYVDQRTDGKGREYLVSLLDDARDKVLFESIEALKTS